MPAQKINFTEPMLLLPAREVPAGTNWAYELKLDGYRALAIKIGGKVHLGSRKNKGKASLPQASCQIENRELTNLLKYILLRG